MKTEQNRLVILTMCEGDAVSIAGLSFDERAELREHLVRRYGANRVSTALRPYRIKVALMTPSTLHTIIAEYCTSNQMQLSRE